MASSGRRRSHSHKPGMCTVAHLCQETVTDRHAAAARHAVASAVCQQAVFAVTAKGMQAAKCSRHRESKHAGAEAPSVRGLWPPGMSDMRQCCRPAGIDLFTAAITKFQAMVRNTSVYTQVGPHSSKSIPKMKALRWERIQESCIGATYVLSCKYGHVFHMLRCLSRCPLQRPTGHTHTKALPIARHCLTRAGMTTFAGKA